MSEATKGDLVFFNTQPKRGLPVSHVAVYNGDGTITHIGGKDGVRTTDLAEYSKKYPIVGVGSF
jgi:cell wall-associated NlpC family hydrolase